MKFFIAIISVIAAALATPTEASQDYYRTDKPFRQTSKGICNEHAQMGPYGWITGHETCWVETEVKSNGIIHSTEHQSHLTDSYIRKVKEDLGKFKHEINCREGTSNTFYSSGLERSNYHADEIGLCKYAHEQGWIDSYARKNAEGRKGNEEFNNEEYEENVSSEEKNSNTNTSGYEENSVHRQCLSAADYKGCMEYHNGETAKNNSDEQEDDGPSAEAVGRAIERSLNILQDTFSSSQPTYNRGGFNPGVSNLETNLMQQRMYDRIRQNNQQRFNRAHPNYAY